jgi:hypothetical protein
VHSWAAISYSESHVRTESTGIGSPLSAWRFRSDLFCGEEFRFSCALRVLAGKLSG